MPGRQLKGRYNHGLLSRYSQTLGEMMLRRHTEQAIRAARVEAELNSRSKSAFLGTMSHELRTPLNAIIGFSDLIRRPDATPAQSAEYAQHIFQAGHRLLDVVSDVMDISKMESGSLVLERQPCAVDEILESAAAATREAFEQKKQQFELRVEPNLPQISADARRMKQLLVNILSNAGKFTPEAGRILLMAGAPSRGAVTIAVADSGPGMSQEQVQAALAPFAQLQSHFVRDHDGTGLGLPLALGLVRLHGGSLKIDSQPGKGTTVILSFPRVTAGEGAA